MGCCLSKKTCPSSSSLTGGSCSIKSPDPNNSATEKSLKQDTEAQEKLELEESTPRNEETQENGKARKEVFVIKHRRSHERSNTTDPEDSTASEEKSTGSNPKPVDVDVDAILIQCGRLSRSNSAASKTRRYSGAKRSFDFDQNEADAEDGGEEEEADRRIHRQRQRSGDSPRERRRRTPSREREDSKGHRSGSRERRVSRSPGRRSEINPNPNPNSCVGSGNSRPGKFVSVPATDKASLVIDNGEPSIKRITVKRNVGEGSRKAASPARAKTNTGSIAQPSPSKLSRKTEHSPYRRNPLEEIDPNSVAYPPSHQGNDNCNKRVTKTENESIKLESGNFLGQKLNPGMSTKTATQAPSRKSAVKECEIVSSSGNVSRSRSSRKSHDFDFSPEALVSNNKKAAVSTLPSYTALLLEDIQNFHQKSVNISAVNSSCSTIEEVPDLNSTTKQQQRRELKKADLMEPSFEKYATVKRGISSLEEQESSGSNSFTGSSSVVGHSSSSSAESTDRASLRSNKKERDRSPLGGGNNVVIQEFDPLKKGSGCVGVGSKRDTSLVK